MDAIEIYQKILEAAKGADEKEALIALDFARNKIQQQQWDKQNAECAKYSALGAANAAPIGQYNPAAQHAEAIQLVRDIAREEIQAANAPAEKQEAA